MLNRLNSALPRDISKFYSVASETFKPSSSLKTNLPINKWVQIRIASLRQNATRHQVTSILATSKSVLFPGHNHLLTTGTDDSTLIIGWAPASHQYRWLAGGYDLEIEHF